MNKAEILVWSGMDSATVDFALPLEWNKQMQSLGVDAAGEFMWHYPKDSVDGRPLSLGSLLLKAINNGRLIPSDILDNIIEMAQSGKYTNDQIKELVKNHCANL